MTMLMLWRSPSMPPKRGAIPSKYIRYLLSRRGAEVK